MHHQIVVDPSSPHSPYFEDAILIENKEWLRVIDYVEAHPDVEEALFAGLLQKYCQKLHLQKIFGDRVAPPAFVGFDDAMRGRLEHCHGLLRRQLRPYEATELDDLMPRLPLELDELRKDRVRFFRSCQPFVGFDRALHLSIFWINKKIYKCTYDSTIEKVLRSFLA